MQKKRIITVLLALMLIFNMLALPSAGAAAPARIDGVDYGRIEENVTLRRKVEIDIGERQFTGYLQNGSSLSNAEVDAIIKTVMNEMEITSGVLRYSDQIIKKAAKNLGFNPLIAFDLGIAFVLGASGLDNAVSVYDVASGKTDVPSALQGFVLGQAVSTVCEKYMAGVAGAVVQGLWNCTDLASQEVARLIEENEIAQQAMERVYLLNLFYNKCNAQIEAAEKEKGGSSWSIVCNQTIWCDKTIFGIKTLQYWRLSCDLERTDFIYGNDDDPTNYGGVYRGTMVIDIWHDLSTFDEYFKSQVFLNASLPFGPSANALRYKDEYSASSLTKTLMSSEVEIHLDQKNMTSSGMTEIFSLKGFSDSSAFKVNHQLIGSVNHHYWNEDGVMHEVFPTPYGPVTVHDELSPRYTFGGGLAYGNRYPELILTNNDVLNNSYMTGPYISQKLNSDSHNTPDATMMTDYQIFSDLRNNRGLLTVVGG